MDITLEEYIKSQLEDATIDEAIIPKFVIRNNRKVKKFISNKPGFKVVDEDGKKKEKKETTREELNRKHGAKIGSPKRVKKGLKKRLNSFKARHKYGIDYDKENPAQRTVADDKKK